jgi:hypothetical protein
MILHPLQLNDNAYGKIFTISCDYSLYINFYLPNATDLIGVVKSGLFLLNTTTGGV